MSKDYKQVGSYDQLRRMGGSDAPPELILKGGALGRHNMAVDWMMQRAGDYPNAQQLAQAASHKFDIPVAQLLNDAKKFK